MSSVRQTFQPFVIRGGSPASAPEDAVKPDGEVKGPLVLAFLDLKDGYSESDLESALIGQLESFLLELGGDFTFVGRQRRLRIGDDWYPWFATWTKSASVLGNEWVARRG